MTPLSLPSLLPHQNPIELSELETQTSITR